MPETKTPTRQEKIERLADEIRSDMEVTVPVTWKAVRHTFLESIRKDERLEDALYIPNTDDPEEVRKAVYSLFGDTGDTSPAVLERLFLAVLMPRSMFEDAVRTHLLPGLISSYPDYDALAELFHVTREQAVKRCSHILED